VAGIAHADVSSVTDEQKQLYYDVNTTLAVETAKKAKEAGVGQFIFMSSMIVYGGQEHITATTLPHPANFYGDSKWQADQEVRELDDDTFKVVVLRPPMIYGHDSKGNYPTLAKIATKMPAFPLVNNRRSVLYIENLCSFIKKMIDNQESGIFFPQNSELVSTSELVKAIADAHGKDVVITPLLSPATGLGRLMPGKFGNLSKKAFGSSYYDLSMSTYSEPYVLTSFKSSIVKTETPDTMPAETPNQKKEVLLLASVSSMIEQFNMPNIKLLQSMGYEVHVACNFKVGSTSPSGNAIDLVSQLDKMGVIHHQIDFDRNALDIPQDDICYQQVLSLVETHGFAFVHCQSPVGGAIARLACHKTNTRVIYTAHGFHFYDRAPFKNWLLYYPIEKRLSHYTDVLITINHEDYQLAKERFQAKETIYIPGIGIDTNRFKGHEKDGAMLRDSLNIPKDATVLLSVGELNRNKNHGAMIRALKQIDSDALYYLIAGQGPLNDQLQRLINKLELHDHVHLLGFCSDTEALYAAANVFVHPSFREGLPVAVMEAMASGLPVAASRIRGCVDLIQTGKGGELFDPEDVSDIIRTLDSLINEDLLTMGHYNQEKVKEFSLANVMQITELIYRSLETSTKTGKE
jgi:glycosyltransferase involved in cell wall biosynthesis